MNIQGMSKQKRQQPPLEPNEDNWDPSVQSYTQSSIQLAAKWLVLPTRLSASRTVPSSYKLKITWKFSIYYQNI